MAVNVAGEVGTRMLRVAVVTPSAQPANPSRVPAPEIVLAKLTLCEDPGVQLNEYGVAYDDPSETKDSPAGAEFVR